MAGYPNVATEISTDSVGGLHAARVVAQLVVEPFDWHVGK
jgi:hypothetical protein